MHACCRSAVCDPLRPHGLYPARLLCPWGFPGKSTGVGCHFLLQGIFPTRGWNPCLLHQQADSEPPEINGPEFNVRHAMLSVWFSSATFSSAEVGQEHLQHVQELEWTGLKWTGKQMPGSPSSRKCQTLPIGNLRFILPDLGFLCVGWWVRRMRH